MKTTPDNRIRIGIFRCDISPPIGHPLCGGWVSPVTHIADPQTANGILFQKENEAPVALVALDWAGVLGAGYDQWREQIAAAIGTSRERVFVHSTHTHEAIWADPEAEILVHQYGTPGLPLDREFFRGAIGAVADAARHALQSLQTVTHIGVGQAPVSQVASNRRIMGADGKVAVARMSVGRDEAIRAAPEGLIDPLLKTISLWNGEQMLASLHFYATHPVTEFGSGGVSAEFVGLAREQLSAETGVPQIYFTGGAGNVAPGKYNDGALTMRPVLAARVLGAMRAALQQTHKEPLTAMNWDSLPVRLPGRRSQFDEEFCLAVLQDHDRQYVNLFQEVSERFCAASKRVWLRRVDAGHAIDFGCLSLGEARIVCFPGEPFIEYQLYAQQLCPDQFVAFAGYGDGAPGYLPTDAAFENGGFETGIWSYVEPCEKILCDATAQLLKRPTAPLHSLVPFHG
jgi:hypothetical protein